MDGSPGYCQWHQARWGPDLQVGSPVQTDVGASWSRQPGDIYVQNLVKIDYAPNGKSLPWSITVQYLV